MASRRAFVSTTPRDDQDAVNRRVYHAPRVHRKYRDDRLDAAEITALAAYGHGVYGHDVLELGVGTGRATRYLVPLARRYVGIDYAPDMVARARDALPHADIRAMDMRNLRGLDEASFDCVVALCNVLDAVSHGDRLVVLAEAYRVLRPGGSLMFSSHNRRHRDAGAPPALERSRNPPEAAPAPRPIRAADA